MPSIKIDSWHPLALRFPSMEGAEWEEFKADIRKTRGNKVPVIFRTLPDGTKQGIDGRNRERACEELCLKCRMEEEILDDDEAWNLIFTLNVRRRHMSIELRREIASEFRQEGMSLRTIAEKLNVSSTTVLKDLKAIEGVNQVTTDEEKPGETAQKITGRDGKEYSASKPPTEKPVKSVILCTHCAHRKSIGRPLIDDCPDCKILRRGEKAEKTVEDRRNAAADGLTEMYDDDNNTVPGTLRLVFADEPLYREAAIAFDNAARIMEQLEKSPGYLVGQRKYGESANVDKTIYWTMARNASIKMRFMRPAEIHTVAEGCTGEKCKDCMGKGYFINGELESK